MKFCRFALYLMTGLLAVLFGSGLTSWGANLEQRFGLHALFHVRGIRPPPAEVVIVSLDKFSANQLGLPDKPEKWPRVIHAHLIQQLSAYGARLVAFNIIFDESHNPAEDQQMAAMMRSSNNVILSDYLKHGVISLNDPKKPDGGSYHYNLVITPTPLFARSALFSAPFALPKTASGVKQFWVHQDQDNCSFPTSVFQTYVFSRLYNEILRLSQQLAPHLAAKLPANYQTAVQNRQLQGLMTAFMRFFLSQPDNLERFRKAAQTLSLPTPERQLLKAWLDLFEGPLSRFLNFYGPPGSFTTFPLYDLLRGESIEPGLFQDKVVFVGYGENLHPEKTQGFYTPFSRGPNDTMSPAEIAATAFANLLQNNWLKPLRPGHQFLLLAGWALVLATIAALLPLLQALGLIGLLGFFYLLAAYYQFSTTSIWLPVAVPLAVQMPGVVLVSLCCHLIVTRREKDSFLQAFKLFLPEDVTQHLTTKKNLEALPEHSELKYGVCLATDAGRYTTLAESLDPMPLGQLINEYYSAIFPPVKQNGGQISDVIGDAMLALWSQPEPTPLIRAQACRAALGIKEAVDAFNATHRYPLPTRIGLHVGMMRIGTVGAREHYEYRAVGDVINTASRIENLNKALGTAILASAAVLEDLQGFCARELGSFILAGKKQAVTIFELLGLAEDIPREQQQLIEAFDKALALFKQRQWIPAHQAFIQIARQFPEDNPTLFYLVQCQRYLSNPPQPDHPEIISVDKQSGQASFSSRTTGFNSTP